MFDFVVCFEIGRILTAVFVAIFVGKAGRILKFDFFEIFVV